jgi:hypothetical protein
MQCSIDFNWIMVRGGTQSSCSFGDVAVLFPTQKEKIERLEFDPPSTGFPCLFLSAGVCATLASTLS